MTENSGGVGRGAYGLSMLLGDICKKHLKVHSTSLKIRQHVLRERERERERERKIL